MSRLDEEIADPLTDDCAACQLPAHPKGNVCPGACPENEGGIHSWFSEDRGDPADGWWLVCVDCGATDDVWEAR